MVWPALRPEVDHHEIAARFAQMHEALVEHLADEAGFLILLLFHDEHRIAIGSVQHRRGGNHQHRLGFRQFGRDVTNMPGRSKPCGFANVARSRILRVAKSTSGLMALSSPVEGSPWKGVGRDLYGHADLSCASRCWGRAKSTYTGSSDCRETMGSPVLRNWPRLIWRMPSASGEGRAQGLF
jgi:hypothetical protein